MTTSKNLIGSGLSGLATQAIMGTTLLGQTATGTNQATAFFLSDDTTVFTTVGSGTGALLPSGVANDSYWVYNNGANALAVYPPVGGAVNYGTVNAAFSVDAGEFAEFRSIDGANYMGSSNDSASGTFTNITVTGVASFADGTAGAPSITNTGDTDTGFYFPAANQVAAACAGAQVLLATSTGLNNTAIGVTTPAAGAFTSLSSTTGLTVSAGTIAVTTPTLNEGFSFYNSNAAGGASIPMWLNSNSGGSITNVSIENAGAGRMVFRTGAATLNGFGTERFEIAASGAATFNGALNATGLLTATGGVTVGTGKTITLDVAGADAVAGNATLVGGTVTVSTTAISAGSLVLLTRKTSGGTIGTAITYTINAGVSFTITSDNVLDTSTFTWVIFN
jgi:predicted enzyme related to lactoylglutathione lyase